MEDTVDKFGLRPHLNFNISCLGAKWLASQQQWEVRFVDAKNGTKFTKYAKILLTAVGGFSQPREIKFPGMDKFRGKVFHTAKWDHSEDYKGKRMAVIGNGCSAAQVVPGVAENVAKLTQ
jgi:cation diffusion facilitator CzcD-associated flavoprotein CzcO